MRTHPKRRAFTAVRLVLTLTLVWLQLFNGVAFSAQPPSKEEQLRAIQEREKRKQEAFQQFFGLNEPSFDEPAQVERHQKLCFDLKQMLVDEYRCGRLNYDDPTAASRGGGFLKSINALANPASDIFELLREKSAPSDQTGNYFGNVTVNYEENLRQMILESPEQVTPAELMKMSLKVTRGNFVLATLTAHNLLKDTAYIGRSLADQNKRTLDDTTVSEARVNPSRPKPIAAVANKLISLRGNAQVGDKLGPWYHMFGVMFLGAMTSKGFSNVMARGEQFTRILGQVPGIKQLFSLLGGGSISRVDQEKAAWDQCGLDALRRLDSFMEKGNPPAKTLSILHASVQPTSGPPGTRFKFTISYKAEALPDGMAVDVSESARISGPVNVPLGQKTTRTATWANPILRKEWTFASSKAGRYNFNYEIGDACGKNEGAVPFEVTGLSEPVKTGMWIRQSPTTHIAYSQIDWKNHQVYCPVAMRGRYSPVTLSFTEPPEVIRRGQLVNLRLVLTPHGQQFETLGQASWYSSLFTMGSPPQPQAASITNGKLDSELIFPVDQPAASVENYQQPDASLRLAWVGNSKNESISWTYKWSPPQSAGPSVANLANGNSPEMIAARRAEMGDRAGGSVAPPGGSPLVGAPGGLPNLPVQTFGSPNPGPTFSEMIGRRPTSTSGLSTEQSGRVQSSVATNGVGAASIVPSASATTPAESYRMAANAGDAEAEYKLAVLYYQGKGGVVKDSNQGMQWLQKSAAHNYVKAQAQLGLELMHDQRFEEAAVWLNKAATQGNAEAQNNLGTLYAKGQGVSASARSAAFWFQKAALQGSAPAQSNLGSFYISGTGVPKNKQQGIRWLQLSARQGYKPAIEMLRKVSGGNDDDDDDDNDNDKEDRD